MSDLENKTTEAPEQIEGNASDQSTQLFLSFLSDLKKLIPIEQQKTCLRLTTQGLFLTVDYKQEIFKIFTEWLTKNTNVTVKSEQKLFKKLFGSLQLTEYYLIEGKLCLMGYLIPGEIKNPIQYGLPYYLGTVLSTKTYIHPRDPYLTRISGITPITTPQGAGFKVTIKEKSIVVTSQFLIYYFKLLNAARPKSRALQSLRDALQIFVTVFKKTKILDDKWRLLVPHKYLSDKKITFFSVDSWVFIVDRKSNKDYWLIEDCYQLEGRNLFRLVWAEFLLFRKTIKKHRIKNFNLLVKQKRYCGVFEVGGYNYPLPPQTLTKFISAIMVSKTARDSLPPHYTVGDCVHKFCALMNNSAKIERNKIPDKFVNHKNKGIRYRSNTGWIFGINQKNVIIESFNI